MTDAAVSTDSAPLTVDQAISSLIPQEVEAPPEAPVEAAVEEVETHSEAVETAAETEAEAAESPEAEAETETEVVVPLEAPKYWSLDAKARFADLPPELQAVVLEQEGPREEAAAKAKAQASEETKAARAELAGVQRLSEQLTTFLPDAIKAFKSQWDDVDWATWAEQDPQAAFQGKIQFDQQQEQLRKLASAQQEAQAMAHKAFIAEQSEKLAELSPELADPEKGAERRMEVARYLVTQGITQEALQNISAPEMVIARKAMLFDQAQANLRARAPKPAPAPVKTVVKPAASPAATTQRPAQQAANRFAQTRSVDDAIALLVSRGQ